MEVTAPELKQAMSGPDANDLAEFLPEGSTFTTVLIDVKQLPDGKTWVFYVRTGTVNRPAECVLLTPNWTPDPKDRVTFTCIAGSRILRAAVITQ